MLGEEISDGHESLSKLPRQKLTPLSVRRTGA